MPDSAQDRTEPPTARRRGEARRRGQVGKSSDLTAAVILLGVVLLLKWTGRNMLGRLLEMLRGSLDVNAAPLEDAGELTPIIAATFQTLAGQVWPVLLVATIVALLVSFAQVGLLFTTRPLAPSLGKLNPVSGLQRMFGGRAAVQMAMGVAKAALLSLISYLTIRSRVDLFAHACLLDHLAVIGVAAEVFFTLAIRLALVLLLLGIIDYIYQRHKLEQELKMTKEEVKDEYKSMEGDPKIKQRRRQVQMQLAIQRIRSAVPKADVVITNPTEYAVVIQYDAETMNAPRVTAKGVDYLARRIRELAIEHGVPIVQRPPLARALYRAVEVGQEIPVQFYRAVAEVLAYVYELAGRRTGRAVPA